MFPVSSRCGPPRPRPTSRRAPITGGDPARIGYARVSTADQSLDAQLDALTAARCGRVHYDKASGTKTARPGLDALQAHLRPGDTVIVTKLDRLGRTVLELLNILDRWQQHDIRFVALDQSIDTATATGRMVCQMLAAVAEFERTLIQERTTAALTARQARGIKGGRPTIMTPEKLRKANKMLATGQFTLAEAAQAIGVSRTTLADHRRTTPKM